MQVRCLALPQLPRYTMFPSSRSRDADPGRVMPKYRDSFMCQIELEPVENSSRLTISVWSDNSLHSIQARSLLKLESAWALLSACSIAEISCRMRTSLENLWLSWEGHGETSAVLRTARRMFAVTVSTSP